ncbi:MAG: carboxypeptidase-like regulatory domain-containing protein [Gemmatimonadota bacterium]|nr:carboxypeptidase regulatory-like domain-containing protein [Gemmatimonadota bacterium]
MRPLRPIPRMALLAGIGLLGALAAPPAAAQVVRGILREAGTGDPIEGAMVVLVDAEGRAAFQVLTNESGRFLMEHRAPGRYRLRADRIGHASTFHPEFALGPADTVAVELIATVEAIVLEGIDVESDARCEVNPEDGRAVAVVWEEVRKALAAASWTGEHGVFRYELAHLERDLDREARRVERERVRYERTSRQRTFVSRPAPELIQDGFVVEDGDVTVFYGPDADVLLSDAFLDTHCFRLRRGRRDTEGLLGLGFEPVDGRRVSEVVGTLWLDPASSELRILEWRYANIDPAIERENVGGRVEFTALPSGPWVIRKWWIRMPIVGFDRRNEANRGRQVIGIRETGAQVRRIATVAGRIVMEFEGGAVQGVVRTDGGARPLADARIMLRGREDTVVADGRGRYRATGLEEGVYAVTFSHPSLDSLGFRSPPREILVPAQGVVDLDLSAPPARRIVAERCGEEGLESGTAALMGWVRWTDGSAAPDARVRVDWSDFRVQTRGVLQEAASGVLATPDPDGFYLVCGLPTDTALRVTVEGADAEPATVRIPLDAWRAHHDVQVVASDPPR